MTPIPQVLALQQYAASCRGFSFHNFRRICPQDILRRMFPARHKEEVATEKTEGKTCGKNVEYVQEPGLQNMTLTQFLKLLLLSGPPS